MSYVIACLNQVEHAIALWAHHAFLEAVLSMDWLDWSDSLSDAALPMFELLSGRRSLLVLFVSLVCTGLNPCLAQEQDRRVQDVMRCQKVEERFTLGRDLGAQTDFKVGGGSQLPAAVRQRLQVAAMRAIDQVFNWDVVEEDYIKIYAETYSTDQLDFILQLCQDPRYQQLMQLEVPMMKDILAVNESYASKIQQATLKAVQHVLQ